MQSCWVSIRRLLAASRQLSREGHPLLHRAGYHQVLGRPHLTGLPLEASGRDRQRLDLRQQELRTPPPPRRALLRHPGSTLHPPLGPGRSTAGAPMMVGTMQPRMPMARMMTWLWDLRALTRLPLRTIRRGRRCTASFRGRGGQRQRARDGTMRSHFGLMGRTLWGKKEIPLGAAGKAMSSPLPPAGSGQCSSISMAQIDL